MKRLEITKDCIACGVCIDATNKIEETEEGTAIVKGTGNLEDSEVESFEAIANDCPANAIKIVEVTGLTQKEGIEAVEDLKRIYKERIEEILNEKLEKKDYEFKKEEYSVPSARSSNEFKYEYKSYEKAEKEGLREFNKIMYSQKRTIIEKVLVEYKNRVLVKYSEYEKKKGNYYYDIQNKIRQALLNVVEELKSKSNGKIDLIKKIETFEVEPTMGFAGDKFDREVYVYQLRHIEEIYIVNNIIEELESVDWFDSWVNSDDMEDYKGKDVYCYDLSEVTKKFGEQIVHETAYILNSSDGAIKLIEDVLKKYRKKLKEDLLKLI